MAQMFVTNKSSGTARAVGVKGKIGRTDLNLLVIFRAIARRKSVTLAAADLALSQPAVSHALNRFRDIVKDPLFIRSGKGLVLTPKAEALLTTISPALAAIEEVVSAAEFNPETDEHVFYVGSSEYASRVILPGIMGFMRKEAPHCQIHAVGASELAFDDLVSGRIDTLFFGDVLEDTRFQHQDLFQEHFVLIVSATHPALANNPGRFSLEDFLTYPHARFSINDNIKGPIDRVLADLGHKRVIGFSSTSFAAAISAVEQSDLICSLPTRLAVAHLHEGLVCLPMPLDIPSYPYRLVWDPRTNSDPASRWFRSRILANFQMIPEPFPLQLTSIL